MPNGDRGQAGAGAEADGGAVGYVAQHGHLDARTWHVDELSTPPPPFALPAQAYSPVGPSGTPVSMLC